MHITVKIIKQTMKNMALSYAEVAHGAGISSSRFKNLMSGRTRMTVDERDHICLAIGISPLDVMLMRPDIISDGILDLRAFPTEFCNLMAALAEERARTSGINFQSNKWKNVGNAAEETD